MVTKLLVTTMCDGSSEWNDGGGEESPLRIYEEEEKE